MLISFFGAEKNGEFESVDIDYPGIPAPLTTESNLYFSQILDEIKKDKNWDQAMFNPIPEQLQKKVIKEVKCG